MNRASCSCYTMHAVVAVVITGLARSVRTTGKNLQTIGRTALAAIGTTGLRRSARRTGKNLRTIGRTARAGKNPPSSFYWWRGGWCGGREWRAGWYVWWSGSWFTVGGIVGKIQNILRNSVDAYCDGVPDSAMAFAQSFIHCFNYMAWGEGLSNRLPGNPGCC